MQSIAYEDSKFAKKSSWKQNLYFLLVFSPIFMVIGLLFCIYNIPAIQTIFLSFFNECQSANLFRMVGLVVLGIAMIMLMMPFALYEFAIGFSCETYLMPIVIVTLAKVIGETASFYLGQQLAPVLKPILNEFKFFNAVEVLTQRKPFKAQILMRMSGITPQLIMNYGMGVVGNVKMSNFLLAANLVGIPSTIIAVFIGKQLNTLRDMFNGTSQSTDDVQILEMIFVGTGIISVGVLIFYVGREYQKVLSESLTEIDKGMESIDSIDLELSHAI